MRTSNGTLGVLVTIVSVTACSDEGGWIGTVTDSAGVRVVTNTDRGMWAEGEGWTLQE